MKYGLQGVLKRVIALSALAAAATFLFQSDANAQWQRRYNKNQVERTIRRAEESSNMFRRDLQIWLDRSNLDPATKEERWLRRASNFENAMDRLRQEFNRRDSWWETRNEVQEVLVAARAVDNNVRSNRFGGTVERRWRQLRTDLNRLARTYNLAAL